MISISFAPVPVAPSAAAGPAAEADAAGFGSAISAAERRPSGISFMPLIATGPGMSTASPAIPQGMLVAGQQPLSQPPLALSPTAAGPLVAPFAGLMESGLRSDPLVQAPRAAADDRMNGLREIFAAALARDQAIRPVRDIIGGAVQSAADRRAANEAALAPAPTPAPLATPAPGTAPAGPGVVDMVGGPSPVAGEPVSQPETTDPVESIAGTVQSELDTARTERPIDEAMKNELARAQEDRSIDATLSGDLEKAKNDRPIEQHLLDSLIAGKDELQLSEEAEQRLVATIADEDGSVDPQVQKELIENANVMLKKKYQEILDSFVKRLAKSPAPRPVDETA